MKNKHKAFLYNLIGFGIPFVISFALLKYIFPEAHFWAMVCAALIAVLVSPRFWVVKTPSGERIFKKWSFSPPKLVR
ncbi:hypothetical protein [Sinomicrobium sp.]